MQENRLSFFWSPCNHWCNTSSSVLRRQYKCCCTTGIYSISCM